MQPERDDGIEGISHDEIVARVDAAKNRFVPSVRPLFRQDDGQAPVLIGCGVLLAVGPVRFILTAAHVIDEFQSADLLIGGPSELLPAEGIARRNDPAPGKTRKEDATDAAVFEIKAGTLSELDGRFLSPSELSPDANPVEGRQYLVLGYPSSRAKAKRPERVIRPQLFPFITTEALDAYDQLDIKRFSHIALTFDQKSVTNGKTQLTAPKPEGLSGCGVWRFDSIWREDWQTRDKLIAILTERHSRKSRCLVATRVAIHLAMIRRYWPELGTLLPESATTTVRLHEATNSPPST